MRSASDLPSLTLDNLGNGSARELFEDELKRVVDNILDPNTRAEAKRHIVLKVTILPDESRRECAVRIEASSKIVANNPAGSTIFVGHRDGKPCALTLNQTQEAFGFDGAVPMEPVAASPEPKRAAAR